MARREVQLFSLSTLDVLTGALGAVIFLFIIVPKGGASASRTAVQAALSYDMRQKQLWGLTADSLQSKKVGDTLLIVIRDLNEMPQAVPCPDCPECKETPRVDDKRPTYNPKTQKVVDINAKVNEAAPPPNRNNTFVNSDEKVVKKDEITVPAKVYNEQKRIDIQPHVPCALAFEVSWETTPLDNVDFYVIKGKDRVGTYSTSNERIGQWTSGITRTRMFEKVDFRTTMEAVRQKSKIIAGSYDLYAQYKATDPKNPRQTLAVKGLIYTKNAQGKEDGKRYSTDLTLNPSAKSGFKKLGTVTMREDGSFDFSQN